MEKRKPYRNKKILRAAEGEKCLIQSPYCNSDPSTTVACHSNELDDGKGIAQKADDCFVAFGCSACHDFVDGRIQGPDRYPDKGQRQEYLDRGIKRTIRKLIDLGVLK